MPAGHIHSATRYSYVVPLLINECFNQVVLFQFECVSRDIIATKLSTICCVSVPIIHCLSLSIICLVSVLKLFQIFECTVLFCIAVGPHSALPFAVQFRSQSVRPSILAPVVAEAFFSLFHFSFQARRLAVGCQYAVPTSDK